jgi:hypothetical protein
MDCNTEGTVTAKELKGATRKDETLSKLIEEMQSEMSKHAEFSLHEGIVMRGHRIVKLIPEKLQKYVLEELHKTHCGIVKTKAIARSICYWRNMDKEIEEMVRSCPACAQSQNEPTKAPLHHWQELSALWQRIHIDFAGPIQGFQFLIVVDAYSKWIHIETFKTDPTSASTIKRLENIFVHRGIPCILVSNNASIFTSAEFEKFTKAYGIYHHKPSPGHPSSNGQAERTVQTFKKLCWHLTEQISAKM